MAVTYKVYAAYLEKKGETEKADSYYAKAQAIIDDLKIYEKDLGFEEGYPYSDQNGVYNYSEYGWKVYRVAALCVANQIDQYEWEDDGTGMLLFPDIKNRRRRFTLLLY
jgi:hypothetical protein